LPINPEFPDAHQNLAHAFLARGQMAEGWKEHEWRNTANAHQATPAQSRKAWPIIEGGLPSPGYSDLFYITRYGLMRNEVYFPTKAILINFK